MKQEVEYKCGCVFSNNRWFPECPRHAEWWTLQAGTGDEFVKNKVYRNKSATLVYTGDAIKAIGKIKDDSVSLVLSHPMLQFDDLEFEPYKYFTTLRPKLKEDASVILTTGVDNLAPLIMKLEASGYHVMRLSNIMFQKEFDILEPCVLVFANLNGDPVKCKVSSYKKPSRTLYFSSLATAEAYLVLNFSEPKSLVLDPFCTTAHTLDGTLHEGRRYIGFCQGAKQFETLKFYLDNFKADQNAFKS